MPRRKSTTTPPQDTHQTEAPPQVPEQQPVQAEQAPSPSPTTSPEAPPAPAKRQIPDPFGIAKDYLAGIQLLESHRYRQMQIRFDEKPSQAAIDAVKEAGFRWNGQEKVWVKPIQPATAMQTRIDSERLFKDVAEQIRQEKGVGRTV